MSTPALPLPPGTRESVLDLCCLVHANPLLAGGAYRGSAARLAARIEQEGEGFIFWTDELLFVADMAEAVGRAVIAGTPLATSKVLVRICERIVAPINTAFGHRS